jgi:aspartate kinase
MNILKFGGTSVGTPGRMKHVAELINDDEKKIVVLSAVAGTTDMLVKIAGHLYANETGEANEKINELNKKYVQFVDELFESADFKTKGNELINSHLDHIRSFTRDMFTIYEEKAVLAQGELISTALFHYYLEETGTGSVLLPALNFMRIDKDHEPDMYYIKEILKREIKDYKDDKLFITQGFICRNSYGEIDNLKRGGSDYSASIIGAALDAAEIQIWTDIDGMHNNDPRYVENTKPIAQLSFDEAAELAYFGAKILHPMSIFPAKQKNIPVRLKNTLNPEAVGTLITSNIEVKGIKAVAAKDGITAIKIVSGRMLLAHGFLRRIFEIFESHAKSIDMITTSEVAVSLTVDDASELPEIISELKKYGSVEVDENQSIICVVGDMIADKPGTAVRIFKALENIPVRMISYGGSKHNVSILINSSDKKNALQALSNYLFN